VSALLMGMYFDERVEIESTPAFRKQSLASGCRHV